MATQGWQQRIGKLTGLSTTPATPFRRILSEAKEEGYSFRLHRGNEAYEAAADDVDVGTKAVVLNGEQTMLNISYRELIEVQPLAKSRVVHLIARTPLGCISWVIFLWPLALGALIMSFSVGLAERLGSSEEFVAGFGLSWLIASYAALFFGFWYWGKQQEQVRLQAVSGMGPVTIGMSRRLEAARRDEEEYFARLIEVNLKNIEDFNSLVKRQTHNSFIVTLGLAIIGFIILVTGIALGHIPSLDTTASNLTIASGVLIEFISAIFFYLYNRTVQQLNRYHKELIDVQDTMLALKISGGIRDDQPLKNQMIRYLTEALVIGRLAAPAKSKQIITPDLSRKKVIGAEATSTNDSESEDNN